MRPEFATREPEPGGGYEEPAGHRLVVRLDAPVGEAGREIFERSVYFASDRIRGFRLIEEAGAIVGVEVDVHDRSDERVVAPQLRSLSAAVAAFRRPRPKEVWRSTAKYRPLDATRALEEARLVDRMGTGIAALTEPILGLLRRLDERIAAMVRDLFGAREYRYPTLIDARAIRDCRYVENFPQFLLLATRLHSDVATYAEARRRAVGESRLDWLLERCEKVEYCLPPTMCFHTYHQMRGRRLGCEPGECVTAMGKAFRFESAYERGLERLFDFTIREVVWMGQREYVADARSTLMRATFELIEELGLAGSCQLASDPFFVDPALGSREVAQHVLEQKFELRMPVAPDRDVAAASFNLHGAFFGQAFELRTASGAGAETACAGFGLERLALGFVARHGVDPAGWPTAMRPTASGGTQR